MDDSDGDAASSLGSDAPASPASGQPRISSAIDLIVELDQAPLHISVQPARLSSHDLQQARQQARQIQQAQHAQNYQQAQQVQQVHQVQHHVDQLVRAIAPYPANGQTLYYPQQSPQSQLTQHQPHTPSSAVQSQNAPHSGPVPLSWQEPDGPAKSTGAAGKHPKSTTQTSSSAAEASTERESDPVITPPTKECVRALRKYTTLTNAEIFRRVGVSSSNGYRYLRTESDAPVGKRGKKRKLGDDMIRATLRQIDAQPMGEKTKHWNELIKDVPELIGTGITAITLKRAVENAGYYRCQACQRVSKIHGLGNKWEQSPGGDPCSSNGHASNGENAAVIDPSLQPVPGYLPA